MHPRKWKLATPSLHLTKELSNPSGCIPIHFKSSSTPQNKPFLTQFKPDSNIFVQFCYELQAKRALGPPGKFLDDTNSTPPGSRPENGDPQITAKMIYDEIMDLKEKGHPSFVGKEFGDGDR